MFCISNHTCLYESLGIKQGHLRCLLCASCSYCVKRKLQRNAEVFSPIFICTILYMYSVLWKLYFWWHLVQTFTSQFTSKLNTNEGFATVIFGRGFTVKRAWLTHWPCHTWSIRILWFWFSFNWKVFWKGLKEQIFLLRVWLPVYPTSGPFIETPPIVFGPVYLPLQGGVLWREVLFLCATSLLISRVCSLKYKDILTPFLRKPLWRILSPLLLCFQSIFHLIWCEKRKEKKILRLISKGKTLHIQ